MVLLSAAKAAKPRACIAVVVTICMWLQPPACLAKDTFLTIGGGYSREGNQASLEANVLFVQQVIQENHSARRSHRVLFADGFNRRADLQVLDDRKSTQPATDTLQSLFSFRRPRNKVIYRNHRVPDISGPISPDSVQEELQTITQGLDDGDRLFIYVTAHGSAAKGNNKFNTTINCWDNQKISAREFTRWLDEVPESVPTIMIMAQCYCGGFSHTIFDQSDASNEISPRLRVGFFAQQHDLAAAGCRPDIKNDEEYSSYFWGALAGRSRNGAPILSVDYNADRQISFAEAHAHAMIASSTIDIPLRTTDALLRVRSRIEGYAFQGEPDADESTTEDNEALISTANASVLKSLQGEIGEIASRARPEQQATILQIAEQLGFTPQQNVTDVFTGYEEVQDDRRSARRSRGRGRRRRGGSGRRQLREEIFAEWPELEDREGWRDSDLIKTSDQTELLDQIHALPAYAAYAKAIETRQTTSETNESYEVKEVKFKRLIQTLESVILADNLPLVASPEIVTRYKRMLELEESFLTPGT